MFAETPCISFIDFEKSLHSDSLCKIVRLYGITQYFVDIIKSFYVNLRCRVLNTSIEFDNVKTGVRQGCVKSSTLFILAINWVLNTTSDIPRGITWDTFTTNEDLDFADDIGLFFHSYQHI